jgi:predicted enzyme related to lactoylglutathione lyase
VDEQRIYPHGVPCWIDTEQPDPAEASRFYGGLFGWTFHDAMPPDAPGSYLIATLQGRDVGAIGTGDPAWNTYIAVDDADAAAAAVTGAGGTVIAAPMDAGPAGRAATCTDPEGAAFRLWQAGRRPGAQIANLPGAWNFSNLRTSDGNAALRFYAAVFGWVADDPGSGGMVRLPGYGDHLAATIDPDIYQRQAAFPPGFADVIGGFEVVEPGAAAQWYVLFTVADRDASAATAETLGATVLSSAESPWTKTAALRDPQGAALTISQFTPPS